MKGSAKPISSPGRREKFPPPLMRFLKSNVGNKSRGRTRASPMFMRKNNDVALETTQEPCSPKVSCIGQVRVRRSSKSTRRSSSTRKKQQKSCCCNIRWNKLNIPKSLVSVLKKWVRGKRVDSSSLVQCRVSTTTSTENVATTTNEEGFVGLDSNSNNPPKNALLLTRCRSAPYRLASRFWGSLSDDTESQMHQNNVPGLRTSHGTEEMQSSTNSEEEEKNGGGAYVHPLLLTRCKSEPARTGERLNPTRFTHELHPQT